MDYGTLQMSDGRQFVGEFSTTFKEESKFEYYQIPVGSQIPMSKSDYIFFGSLSNNGVTTGNGLQEWAVEKSLKDRYIIEEGK